MAQQWMKLAAKKEPLTRRICLGCRTDPVVRQIGAFPLKGPC